jgi:hypothetical protein
MERTLVLDQSHTSGGAFLDTSTTLDALFGKHNPHNSVIQAVHLRRADLHTDPTTVAMVNIDPRIHDSSPFFYLVSTNLLTIDPKDQAAPS